VTGPAAPAFEVQESSPDPSSVERLLRLLPEWFGIESSIVSYVEDARYEETVLARPAGAPQAPAIGALLLRTHFPEAAEIHLLAVEPAWHRQGVGSALVHHAEERLEARGVGVLSVKTLGPSPVPRRTPRQGASMKRSASCGSRNCENSGRATPACSW
jgi:ribosomal protein S18 acetylase RimI-like enzyme